MSKALFIFFLVILTSVKGQELNRIEEFIGKTQESKSFFIVFGHLGCVDCYSELFTYLKVKVSNSSIYFLSISTDNPLVRRNTMNKLHSDYNIGYDKIYFISNESVLVNEKEPIIQQYPKLLVIDKLKNIRIYNYSFIFNEKSLYKKRVKKIIK